MPKFRTFWDIFNGYIQRRMIFILIIVLVFAIGTGFGALTVKTLSTNQKEDLSNYLQSIFTSVPEEIHSLNRAELAHQGMVDNIVKTTGLMWLLGLSVIGSPFILALVFLRGFVLGFTIGFLVEDLVLRGVFLTLLSILPHNLIIVPAIIIGATASLSFSFAALKTLIGLNNENIYHQFFGCAIMVIFSWCLLGLGALVETFLTPILIEFGNRFL